jgi:hypothetical protein
MSMSLSLFLKTFNVNKTGLLTPEIGAVIW